MQSENTAATDPNLLRSINGPVYVFVDRSMKIIHRVSLVEWWKRLGLKFVPSPSEAAKRKVANVLIDVFIAFKWLLLLFAWVCGITNRPILVLFTYLLVLNVHTYCWYHLWLIDERNREADFAHWQRRRFVNLLSAISYSMATYAYFYHRVLFNEFEWPKTASRGVAALTFSVGC